MEHSIRVIKVHPRMLFNIIMDGAKYKKIIMLYIGCIRVQDPG
jgi:hypothetical protein